MNTVTRALARLLAGVLALSVLVACGGEDDADGGETGAASASAEPTTPAASDFIDVPPGVTLTEAGTELELGEEAVVAWQPRQDRVVAARVRVQSVQRTSFDQAFQGFRITDQMAAMTPFFVRARVVNPTKSNIGGIDVPIYLRNDAGTLVEETTLRGAFPPCPGSVLPKKFPKGSKTKICLVFLIDQRRSIESVAFRAPGDLEPITWRGDIGRYRPQQSGNGNS